MTNSTPDQKRCAHFDQPPIGVTVSATVGPWICPWCRIERLESALGYVKYDAKSLADAQIVALEALR